MKRLTSASAVLALGLVVATPDVAGAALPRPGYWEGHIGRGGPVMGLLIEPNRRHITTLIGRADVVCPDGHTHTIVASAADVHINPLGAFTAGRIGPPFELDHSGVDGWRLAGSFTGATLAQGRVSFLWTGQGEPCTAPRDRRTWSARWRANPVLRVVPDDTVRRGSILTLRGSGYLPRRVVRLELPNRVLLGSTVGVLMQQFTVRADSRGRFRARVRINRRMPTGGSRRVQAWQLECRTVCWVQAETHYHVTSR